MHPGLGKQHSTPCLGAAAPGRDETNQNQFLWLRFGICISWAVPGLKAAEQKARLPQRAPPLSAASWLACCAGSLVPLVPLAGFDLSLGQPAALRAPPRVPVAVLRTPPRLSLPCGAGCCPEAAWFGPVGHCSVLPPRAGPVAVSARSAPAWVKALPWCCVPELGQGPAPPHLGMSSDPAPAALQGREGSCNPRAGSWGS